MKYQPRSQGLSSSRPIERDGKKRDPGNEVDEILAELGNKHRFMSECCARECWYHSSNSKGLYILAKVNCPTSLVQAATQSLIWFINNFMSAGKISSFHQIGRACQFGFLLLNSVPQASRQICFVKRICFGACGHSKIFAWVMPDFPEGSQIDQINARK